MRPVHDGDEPVVDSDDGVARSVMVRTVIEYPHAFSNSVQCACNIISFFLVTRFLVVIIL